MRDIVFIGHANPEDNNFATWLYSKLENEGYKAWCDLIELYGGERDFWENIQNKIRNESCKYLFVFSKSSFKKDGIKDEFMFARSIANEFALKDFVIPLRIEKVSYNIRIGINRYNVIDFSDSWSIGLKKLFKKLVADNIPKNPNKKITISDWILNMHETKRIRLIKRKEMYYSNWWPVKILPESIYLFQYSKESLAQAIIEEGSDYPIVKHGNYLVSFERNIKNISGKNNNLEINPVATKSITINNILEGYESDDFPNLIDSQNLLKRLLKKAFKNLMYERGLHKKEISKNQCFFYHKGLLFKNQAIVNYHNRTKRKKLVGTYHDKFWHYGVSVQPRLSPYVCFSLKSHILFSDDGYNIWGDDYRLHSARRSKCKRWFNETWRDLLMAFISSLAREKKKIEMQLKENFSLEMPFLTKQFYSSIGYNEPKTKDRLYVSHEIDEDVHDITDINQDHEEKKDELGDVFDD